MRYAGSTVAVFWVLLLAACGGGGGSTDAGPGTGGGIGTGLAPTLALFAGNMGGQGNVDGIGPEARFAFLTSAAIDSAGNVYVTDANSVRKITPVGEVTMLAGTHDLFGIDFSGGNFNTPQGIAVDAANNVYVADTNNSTIRKISPAGAVTTIAGVTGGVGDTDSAGGTPTFSSPEGLAVDSKGNVYVADANNNAIRRITPAGVVSTLAPGTLPLNRPQGVATDGADNLYVADSGNNVIQKITSAGAVSVFAGTAGPGSFADGTGAAARFNGPVGIAADSKGTVYVADTGNGIIRRISSAGVVTTLAGTAGTIGISDATGPAARFNAPIGIAVDASGNIYVADGGNNTLRKIVIVASAGVVTTLAGVPPVSGATDTATGPATFNIPVGATADSAGNLYVADGLNNTIRKITPGGVVTTLAGSGSPGSADAIGAAASFRGPQGITIDGAGNLYVADSGNSTIRKVTPDGAVSTFAGQAGSSGSADGFGNARFQTPVGVRTDSIGNVYVADQGNHTIRRITPFGFVSTLAGTASVAGSTDAIGRDASFNSPSGIAVDDAGNVYVADAGNHVIRKITPDGLVSTLAGTAALFGSADGTGPEARFFNPLDVVTDGAGNLYVTDQANNTIRKVTPAGVVTTVAGVAGQMSFSAGGLPGQLGQPRGLAFLGTSLYVTQYNGVAVIANVP